jgi:hypothetical protein
MNGIVEKSEIPPDAQNGPLRDEEALPSSYPSEIRRSVYHLLVWLRDTRPDLFLTIVSPIKGHKLLPPEE